MELIKIIKWILNITVLTFVISLLFNIKMNEITEQFKYSHNVYNMLVNERVLKTHTAMNRFKTVDMLGTNTTSMDNIRLSCTNQDVLDIILPIYKDKLPEFCAFLDTPIINL